MIKGTGQPMTKSADKKYFVYQDTEQWIPLFNWFWIEQPPLSTGDGMGHGAYPAKWIATLSAWVHTRNV